MKIKTSELTGAALDWAVAKCEEYSVFIKHAPVQVVYTPKGKRSWYVYRPSTNDAQGGPIIEREGISLDYAQAEDWGAKSSKYQWAYGPTHLVAAMRCYVASKLGDEVEIPEELI
jgi:hypothetical protein